MADKDKKNLLIPNMNSVSSKKGSRNISPHSNYLREQRRAVIEAASPAITGNGPYRGIVLRRHVYDDRESIPLGTWLEVHYNNLDFLKGAKLVAYKVYIPELHSMLPQVNIYSGSTVSCSEHSIIDLYPYFVVMDAASDPQALPGEIVIVDFGDKSNFEDGRFIKKVFSKNEPPPSREGCKDAMEVLLESCGLPPLQEKGGQWIGSDGLKERLLALSTLERSNFYKLAVLGRVSEIQTMADGSPLKHGAHHREIATKVEIKKRDAPAHLDKAYKKYIDSLKPFPLRGPCATGIKGLRDLEQMENAWMFPWYKDDNEYPTGFLESLTTKTQKISLENQQKLLEAANEALNQLGPDAWESARKAKIEEVKYHQDIVSKLRQSLRFNITVADKGRTLYETFVSTADVYEPKQVEEKAQRGLIYGFRLKLAGGADTSEAPPSSESLEMRKSMIYYYETERDTLATARKEIERLLKTNSAKDKVEKKKEELQTALDAGQPEEDRKKIAAEKARIERFKALCPEGDNFSSTSYAIGYSGDPKDAPYMKKSAVGFDKLGTSGRRRQNKSMKDHPKRTYFVRSDVRARITRVINIVNNLGGVVGLIGNPSRNLENNPQRGEKGKSKTSYHYIFKAFDLNSIPSTLNKGSLKSGEKFDIEAIKQQSEYVITKEGKYLHVWAKASMPPGTSYGGYQTQHRSLEALICSAKAGEFEGKAPTATISGTYIDLTQILLDHGFKRSTPVTGWWNQCGKKSGKSYRPRAEWWHWQLPEPAGTTWEAALLSIYEKNDVEDTQTYKHKNFVATGSAGSFKKKKAST